MTTRFGYDCADMIAEYNSSNALQRSYVLGPSTDEPIVWYEGNTISDRRFLTADERGSIVAGTNSSGTAIAINAYDEYGIPTSTNLRRFQYTGQTWLPEIAMRDELCRRFMAIPGIGTVTALSFSSAIDDPSRFRRSRNVAAYFGLTSKRWQSGTLIDVHGPISKAVDPDVRRALYEAASAMLTRFKGRDTIKTWGLKLAKTRCHAKARVAFARKLAVIMHAMWRDGTFYVGNPDASAHEVADWNAAKVQRLSMANA